MAMLSIVDYFKEYGLSFVASRNRPAAISARFIVAETFGTPEDGKIGRSWKQYVSEGIENPIGYRGINFLHWPYLFFGGLRNLMCRGIDQLVIGENIGGVKGQTSPWWAVGLKFFVSFIFPIPGLGLLEIPAFFLSKIGNAGNLVDAGYRNALLIKYGFKKEASEPESIPLQPIGKSENKTLALTETPLTKQKKPGWLESIRSWIFGSKPSKHK